MSTVSLGLKLVQAAQKEAAMQRPLPLQATATVPAPGKPGGSLTAEVTLTDHDRFSHLVEVVTVSLAAPPTRNAPTIDTQDRAQRFAQRATYLSEALQFVEKDARGNATLRSTPSTMRGSRSEYFEAQIATDAISLRRYKPHTDKAGREPVAFCVTDEVLARLADDATAVLVPPSNK